MISARTFAAPTLGVVSIVISACGGGGGSSQVAPPTAHDSHAAIAFNITMPAPPPNASAGVRKRFAVSTATQGLVVQAYVSPYTGTSSPVATGTFDVSSTSGLCTTNPTDLSRTCSGTLAVPAGTYDLQVVNYDQAPGASGIPATAHQLGYGFVAAQTVTAGTSSSIALTVAGIAKSLRVTMPVQSVRALEASTQHAAVAVLDAAGSVILGSYIDGANNAVTVTMSDSATTGLVSFSPSSFSSSLSSGVTVSYSPSALTQAMMSSGAFPTVTGTLSTGPSSSTTIQVTAPVNKIVPTAFSTGAPSDVAPGSDGAMYAAMSTGGDIGRIVLPTNSATTIGVGSNPNPLRIVAGPDNNVWATANLGSGGVIKVAIPALTTTLFPTPTFSSKPYGIASDGTNLWITENNVDKVAKVTTSGTMTEYNVLSSGANLKDIALGADARMWFVEQAANRVGAVDASGAVTEYVIPSASASALSICAGRSGGNDWYTESGVAKIAAISTSGVSTEYPVPSITGSLYCTLGPDNNIWFIATTASGFGLGRVTLPAATTIDVFPLPYATNPMSIRVGSDGALWIADSSLRGVLRVQI